MAGRCGLEKKQEGAAAKKQKPGPSPEMRSTSAVIDHALRAVFKLCQAKPAEELPKSEA